LLRTIGFKTSGDAIITDLWIQFVIDHPVKEVIQEDGRIRRWAPIDEAEGRYLLADGETVHNAFFDRSFTPMKIKYFQYTDGRVPTVVEKEKGVFSRYPKKRNWLMG